MNPDLIQEQFDRMHKEVHKVRENVLHPLTVEQTIRIVNSDKNRYFKKCYLGRIPKKCLK